MNNNEIIMKLTSSNGPAQCNVVLSPAIIIIYYHHYNRIVSRVLKSILISK